MRAVVVDANYGSVTAQELSQIQSAYSAAGIDLTLHHLTTEQEIISECQGAMAILATGNPPLTRSVLEALPDLKFIQRFGIGVNSIDLEAAAQREVVVLNLPGFCVRELADLAASMILGLIRNTGYYDREIRKGGWPKCQYFLPGDVRKMTLGLYGFGGAAQQLCHIFQGGFGTKVIACDPYLADTVKQQFPDVEFVTFHDLLSRSDIISIHVNLTPETTHVFRRDTFCKMKNSAMIINTARGAVIDQKDLVWALEHGEIRYAGLDTLEQEPIAPDDPLLHMDNVILTPHSGSYGAGAKQIQLDMVCQLIPQAVTQNIIPARCVANRSLLSHTLRYQFT